MWELILASVYAHGQWAVDFTWLTTANITFIGKKNITRIQRPVATYVLLK
jgi:hypothetical protein